MTLRSLAIGVASIALIVSPALAAPAPAPPPAATAAQAAPADAATAKPKLTKAERHDINIKGQEKLKSMNLYSGPVDGKHNADFIKAVKDFQTAHNLKASGHLNKATQMALGI